MVDLNESKVVWKEGDEIKTLRGKIVARNDKFLVLKRKDGLYEINISSIIKIYTPNSEGGGDETS